MSVCMYENVFWEMVGMVSCHVASLSKAVVNYMYIDEAWLSATKRLCCHEESSSRRCPLFGGQGAETRASQPKQ